jgi:CBS domain-containing protein/sporulation protein YlmC with PRC-barrel domain
VQLHLTSLKGRKVVDAGGDRAATVVDFTIGAGQPTSEVRRVILRAKDGLWSAGANHLAVGSETIICDYSSWEPFESCAHDEVRLLEVDVDKQVIDIEIRKVTRVNDILLDYSNKRLSVVAVCVGTDSFLRRLLGERLSSVAAKRFGAKENLILWHLVQPLGSSSSSLRLTVSWNKTGPFHPADLADLMEDLDTHEQMAILSALDNEKAADTLAKIEEDDLATQIIRRMDPDKASDIMEEMSPDDAADILSDLPKPNADAILSSMEQPSRASLTHLMGYGERTAGGIMTTEYLSIPSGLTVEQVIVHIRERSEEAETIYYGYVTDPEHRLVGVFSLRQLIMARPSDPMDEIMTHSVIQVLPEASDSEVVDLMSKYDLLALPVVDEQGKLLGIITVDDVVDVLEERGAWIRVWKRRQQN